MPQLDLRVAALLHSLEHQTLLAEPLLFPEISVYGEEREKLRSALAVQVRRIVKKIPPGLIYSRQIKTLPKVETLELEIEPAPRSKAWSNPLTLCFQLLVWSQGEDGQIAYVPALGIEVLAQKDQDLHKLAEEHIRFALARREALGSLSQLVFSQRMTQSTVEWLDVSATVRTPKEIAIEQNGKLPEKPVLKEIADELNPGSQPPAYEVDALVAQVVEALSADPPRSVLLVGRSGCGKTALTLELVRQRARLQLGQMPVWSTSGSRIVAGMTGYGMWQERCRRLLREVSQTRALVLLGNLLELTDAGKAEGQDQGIAGFLRSAFERGTLLTIVECTPEQQQVLERRDPHLLSAFEIIRVPEPEPPALLKILECTGYLVRTCSNVTLGEGALEKISQLHRRFAAYSAAPGRPLRFLKNLMQDAPADTQLGVSAVTAAFSRETGLPLFMLDPDLPLDLDATRRWFGARVLGQPDATELLLEVLAAAKTGLTRPRRPLASLLFIGPTGVGKTEMAKALAEFLFGNRARLSRFDMSEYAEAHAVERLTGAPPTVGSHVHSEGLLTAKVREQPFSVLLFDEFEKAHPLFFDFLLQVLGDARLTDASGRVADFSNAVVIMTSNLGAQGYQQGRPGFNAEARSTGTAAASAHFMKEAREFFRPEFFNRIDRIVPFLPLDEACIHGIVRRELELLSRRDGLLQRRVTLSVANEVVAYLARTGMDAKYGARPLKRAIERELLVPLAEGLNSFSSEWALRADVTLSGEKLDVKVRVAETVVRRPQPATIVLEGAATLAADCTDLRRRLQRLERCEIVQESRTGLLRLTLSERQEANRRRKKNISVPPNPRLEELRRTMGALDQLSAETLELEESSQLLLLDQASGTSVLDLTARRQELTGQLSELLLDLFALSFPQPHQLMLGFYGENSSVEKFRVVRELVRYYLEIFPTWKYSASLYVIGTGKTVDKAVRALVPDALELLNDERGALNRAKTLLRKYAAPDESTYLGLALSVSGRFAQARLYSEDGVHEFVNATGHVEKVRVHASDVELKHYLTPPLIVERDPSAFSCARRRYTLNLKKFEDLGLKREFTWSTARFEDTLTAAIEAYLRQQLEKLLA